MPDFPADDVRTVACALTTSAIDLLVVEDANAYHRCRFCGASVPWQQPAEQIVHKGDCPVTVARRLLAIAASA
ncbi:hypothetical protein A33M_0233 [Rhodovulum sp. PH10]|uniref:DUF3222 family protein n=1 Tax=Rhodovulum sp. PH10 TaxID=1187851 RepID=UPI00027C23D4|nr:DUF3222 family protein [Rhodovulum sp. PH10]EJW10296.1 hypothetical protein A33M_0233 [Rhodovulum sp. PH10]